MSAPTSDLAPLPAPASALLDATGHLRSGAYRGAPASLPLERAYAPGLGPLAAAAPGRRRLRGLRRKTWRWVGVFQDDLVVSAAVADLGYLGLAWAYVAEGGRLVERGWKAPLAAGVRVGGPGAPSAALAPGRLVSMQTVGANELTLTLELEQLRAGIDLRAADPAGLDGLTVVSDTGKGAGRPGGTVKRACLAAKGAVVLGDRRVVLDRAWAFVDWTQAYFPRRMSWWWAAGAGLASDGRPVGLNLCRGVHDEPAAGTHENALWLDGVPASLPAVSFLVGEGRTPWTIRSDDGAVDLAFEPAGERREATDLVLVASRYRQPYGHFSGTLRDGAGRTVRLDRLPGVTEHHDVTW